MQEPTTIDWFAAALSSALGLIGRLMYLSEERRQPITWSLLWELPTAIAMGLIGRGVGDYLRLEGFLLFTVSIVFGYLGPRVISWAIQLYANRLQIK